MKKVKESQRPVKEEEGEEKKEENENGERKRKMKREEKGERSIKIWLLFKCRSTVGCYL